MIYKNPEIWLVESTFDHIQLKIYKTSFMFLESISLCQKSNWSIILFLRYNWFKNPAISLADSILAHNSRTRIFPDMGFVHAKANNNFHLTPNPEKKVMITFLEKVRKPWFLPILNHFAHFIAKMNFLKNNGLSVFRFYNYLPSWK